MPYGPATLMRAAPRAPKTYTTQTGSYITTAGKPGITDGGAPAAGMSPTGASPASSAPAQHSTTGGFHFNGGMPTQVIDPPAQQNGGGQNPASNQPATGGPKHGNGMGVGQYTGADEQYLNALAALKQNLDMFKTENTGDRQGLRQDFLDTLQRMKLQHGEDATTRNADYAARGLFGSGLDAANRQDFNLNYNQQVGDATQSRDRNLQQLISDMANARMLYKQQREAERLKAIQRASAQYGITG